MLFLITTITHGLRRRSDRGGEGGGGGVGGVVWEGGGAARALSVVLLGAPIQSHIVQDSTD